MVAFICLIIISSHCLYKITNKATSVLARVCTFMNTCAHQYVRASVRTPVHRSSPSYPFIFIWRIVWTHPYVRPSTYCLLLIRSSSYRELSECICITFLRRLAPKTNSLCLLEKNSALFPRAQNGKAGIFLGVSVTSFVKTLWFRVILSVAASDC